ncbi:hypothetical protein BASA81_005319 [Batrachochytrium salamandrivorans]|nr:hypothetical protein BASA81_005319 [Batrachochytrium salamandrivorans]
MSSNQHLAVLCKNTNGHEALTLESVPTLLPTGKEVLVEVAAAGLNYPDVLMSEGRYQIKPPYPFSPGGELAGHIAAVGDQATKFKVGDRVVSLCGWGGFQEKTTLREDQCIKIPDFLPLDVAAGFLFTYGTTIHALRDRGELKRGEYVLVLGASGGTGISAIEIAKAMGAIVIAAASTQEKLDLCTSFGADFTINYSTEKLKTRLGEITKGHGVDVCYDAVGGDHAEPALRSMAWRGRYLVIGFVGGIPKIPLNLTLLKGCSIVGVFWGSFTTREPKQFETDVQQLFDWYANKQIRPVSKQRFALKDAKVGIAYLKDRKVLGKAIVVMKESKL